MTDSCLLILMTVTSLSRLPYWLAPPKQGSKTLTKTFLILMWLQVMTFAMASDICYEIKEVAQFSFTQLMKICGILKIIKLCGWSVLSRKKPMTTSVLYIALSYREGEVDSRMEGDLPWSQGSSLPMGLSGPPLLMFWPLPLCRLCDITGVIRMTNRTVWQWRGATVHKDTAASAVFSSSLLSLPHLAPGEASGRGMWTPEEPQRGPAARNQWTSQCHAIEPSWKCFLPTLARLSRALADSSQQTWARGQSQKLLLTHRSWDNKHLLF